MNSASANTSATSRTEARFEKNSSTASKKDSNDSPMVAAGTTGYFNSRDRRRSFSTRPPVCSSGQ